MEEANRKPADTGSGTQAQDHLQQRLGRPRYDVEEGPADDRADLDVFDGDVLAAEEERRQELDEERDAREYEAHMARCKYDAAEDPYRLAAEQVDRYFPAPEGRRTLDFLLSEVRAHVTVAKLRRLVVLTAQYPRWADGYNVPETSRARAVFWIREAWKTWRWDIPEEWRVGE